MGSRTVILLFCASVCMSLLASVEGQQTSNMMCYACTYRTVGQISVGDFCNEPFRGAMSPNVTCDTACVKRTTTGAVKQVKRGCYSDLMEGTRCETYYRRQVPNSNPPEYLTQTCCSSAFCNHGSLLSARLGVVAFALIVGKSFAAMFV